MDAGDGSGDEKQIAVADVEGVRNDWAGDAAMKLD